MEIAMTTTTLINNPIETVTNPRAVERLIAGQPTSDGAGVKLTRVLTHTLQRRLDPFLMLDAFGTDNPQDYIGGCPGHPPPRLEKGTHKIARPVRHRPTAGHPGPLSDRRGAREHTPTGGRPSRDPHPQ